jgi:two-component system sensor histidine kinase BaeS
VLEIASAVKLPRNDVNLGNKMRNSIALKLILAFLVISLISLIFVGVLTRNLTNTTFQRYLNAQSADKVVELFTNYYERNGSWAGVRQAIDRKYTGMIPFTLYNTNGRVIYGKGSEAHLLNEEKLPIEVDGKLVGYLLVPEIRTKNQPAGEAFLSRLDIIFSYSIVGSAIIALLLGWVMSRYLTRPIRELTAATRALADGETAQVVPVRSNDELGELAESFNRMNEQLARSMKQRRQMTADIAHELRTPLSVIIGHADGIHDGVLPLSMDTVEIIRDEATRLEGLVEDLRTLSLSDAGELSLNKEPLSPATLLNDAKQHFSVRALQKKITLNVDVDESLPGIQVDPARMMQVLGNILENAIRHTPENGEIALRATQTKDAIQISVQDSGEGLPADEAAHIFDRFYRVDPSRQRESGGSGLGLAISKSIIEGHGGKIWAESEKERGLTVYISLPI